jgi:hypothetical protein
LQRRHDGPLQLAGYIQSPNSGEWAEKFHPWCLIRLDPPSWFPIKTVSDVEHVNAGKEKKRLAAYLCHTQNLPIYIFA